MPVIYALLCEHNKWYIGRINQLLPIHQVLDHFSRQESRWLQQYKPMEIHQIWDESEDTDEDKYTKMYMEQYGIENVRGGSYMKIQLSEEQVCALQREIFGPDNLCFRCAPVLPEEPRFNATSLTPDGSKFLRVVEPPNDLTHDWVNVNTGNYISLDSDRSHPGWFSIIEDWEPVTPNDFDFAEILYSNTGD